MRDKAVVNNMSHMKSRKSAWGFTGVLLLRFSRYIRGIARCTHHSMFFERSRKRKPPKVRE